MESELPPQQQQQQGQSNVRDEAVREIATLPMASETASDTDLGDLELLQLQARQGRIG